MAKDSPPSAKDLRKRAKALDVEGWKDMNKEELQAAIDAAEGKSTSKATKGTGKAEKAEKKPAKKTAAAAEKPKREPKPKAEADPNNPFRPNTNLWHITEALRAGGKRSELVKKLKPVLEFNPRKKSKKDFDTDEEIDRRLKVIGYILKNKHGWDFTHEGRGGDAFIQATPPGATKGEKASKPAKGKKGKK